MRLIDADELRKCAIPCEIHNGASTDLCVPLYQIDNAPTIIWCSETSEGLPLMDLRPRPKGEWITENLVKPYGKCNQCCQICEIDNYCGNCGAKMKGGAE